MHVVRLSAADSRLLAARHAGHGNSHRRMRAALGEAGATAAVARLDALRALERRFQVDLAAICALHQRRAESDGHPIERLVISYVTESRASDQGDELWVLLDRVSDIRDLIEGRLVGEPGS
ncbi:MAG: hypothetical protein L0271_26455 [Gemmatimonadetes bacterium]|nr:hypothetical protein [Gemmatimonadota bacterium]